MSADFAPRTTPEQIRAEVTRFWNRLSSKSAEGIEEFYTPESAVFGTTAHRLEPGRLAAARRRREYFHDQTTMEVKLGPIEVTILGDVGIAAYTFEFHAKHAEGALGKEVDEEFEHGRATQVFAPDADGRLRIIHEHLSVAVHG